MQFVRNPFVFIGFVALIAALFLSVVSEYTSDMVKNNKEMDRKRNILLARYLEEFSDPNHPYIKKLSNNEDLKEIYNQEIQELLFLDDGSLPGDSDLDFSKLVWKENKKDGSLYYFFKNKPEKYLPLFLVKETNGYIIPISGKGLWSTIKGFIYIIPVRDQESYVSGQFAVKGISFYEHGETPGLGGEIDKYDIKKRYLDKQINLKEQKTPNMTKAIVDERYELEYISGATITSDGLDSFIASHILDRYKNILTNDVHTSKVDYE